MDEIHAKLEALKKNESTAWIEIEYTGNSIISDLREMIDETVSGSAMEIRRVKNRVVMDRVIRMGKEEETLDDLEPADVFTRCLDVFEVPEEDREELTASYNLIVQSIYEDDKHVD